MTRLMLALLAGAAFAVPARAAQEPRAGRWDARMRTVPYNSMNPVRVVGTTMTSTQIIFAVGETITHIAIGDSEAWLPQPTANLLFIKPVEVRAATNMQVVTTKGDGTTRSYAFDLIARSALTATSNQVASLDGTVPAAPSGATPFTIQFTYPEDARQEAADRRQRAAAGAAERKAEDRLAVDYFYGPRNWRYAAQGSHAIEPTEVSDNGRLTAMRFPGNATVPTIYTIAADGQETLVPYTMKADVAVVSTTAREFRLRYGGEIVRVINLAYDPIGPNPQTGTTTPEILRSVRAPRS